MLKQKELQVVKMACGRESKKKNNSYSVNEATVRKNRPGGETEKCSTEDISSPCLSCWPTCSVPLLLRSSFGFPGGSEVKASACSAGDLGSIPASGRFPWEGNGNPLQYSCLENPMDGGAWWATVHRVSKSRTPLSDFTFIVSKIHNLSTKHAPSILMEQITSSPEIF